MCGDIRVSVKAVDNIKILCVFRCLLGKIGSASSADDKYIDFVFVCEYIICAVNRNTLCEYLHGLGVAACENSFQLHVCVLTYSALDTSAEVSVS